MCSEFSTIFAHWWYTDYASDIIRHLIHKEQKRNEFQYQSPQADYRQNSVEFIRNNAEKLDLSRTSVHLAVYMLDIFMDNHKITLERLQMVSLVCLLLASKLEDRDSKIPKLSTINNLLDVSQPLSDYFSLEAMILRYFDWHIIIPTAATFLEYYVLAVTTENDFADVSKDESNLYNFNMRNSHDFRLLAIETALEFLDMSLSDTSLSHGYLPSCLACACIAAARTTLKLDHIWPIELEEFTKYKYIDIQLCEMKLLENRRSLLDEFSNKRKTPDSGYLSDSSTTSASEDDVSVTIKRSRYEGVLEDSI